VRLHEGFAPFGSPPFEDIIIDGVDDFGPQQPRGDFSADVDKLVVKAAREVLSEPEIFVTLWEFTSKARIKDLLQGKVSYSTCLARVSFPRARERNFRLAPSWNHLCNPGSLKGMLFSTTNAAHILESIKHPASHDVTVISDDDEPSTPVKQEPDQGSSTPTTSTTTSMLSSTFATTA
jgi:hypothetical protein